MAVIVLTVFAYISPQKYFSFHKKLTAFAQAGAWHYLSLLVHSSNEHISNNLPKFQ